MKKELLSPAGDFETLKQAIHNGCDAVYLGGKRFGARKFASNFDDFEMIKAIKYCHLYGVKIYVTVNTIIYNYEIDDFLEYVTFLHKNGVDAVIMQDMGMISLVRKVLPNLDIHASTQAHTHNIEQIRLLEKLGVTRIVTAREMSLEEIKSLDTNLEIETFIHGALCVCYSGQCLFSSMLLSRSGNRGECAGICRLPFKLLEDGREIDTNGKYLLSPKELNTTNHIKELLESNITSFKIEGRMKSPATIGYITRLYRMLIDHYEKGEEVKLTDLEQEKLLLLFNRGFTEGYLFNKSGRDLMNISSPNHIGIEIGKVLDVSSRKIKIKLSKDLNQEDGIKFKESDLGMITNFIYDENDKLINCGRVGQIIYLDNKIGLNSLDSVLKTVDKKLIKELENFSEKKIKISVHIDASIDNGFTVKLSDYNHQVCVNDSIVDKALKNGTSEERILEQISKLGDTPFVLTECSTNIENGIFVPISKINELRRKAVEELISLRKNNKKEVIINKVYNIDKCDEEDNSLKISALVRNEEQLIACLLENIDIIYVTDYLLYLKYKDKNNVYYRVNRVISKYPLYNGEKLLIGEMGSFNKYGNNNIINGDYYLNVVNRYHIDYLRNLGFSNITLSCEGSFENTKSIIEEVGNKGIEVIIYGRLECMIMKYCPLKMLINNDSKACRVCKNGKKYALKDRNNAIYPLIQDNELTHIMYHNNLDKENELEDLYKVGIRRFRFEFFDEKGNDVHQIIKKYKSVLSKTN